ncbi:hypothetical protein GCM10010915_12200 [Microbacterium faecale]|uniref:IrrE N-terminal-like domain-containing protein n=1 Tax=Microbacterium faecale TaxID=1804630 RepID=A0A916Y7D3_9MICO|nr:ImmA/IrrE family metallo-endopeptidase [Microbacterium faecale]GGD33381.1 hypothetical protein GCM10010915_12200 [Microbacterium faecale]
MKYLLDVAHVLGVTIVYTDLTHLHRDGDYDHSTKTIRLQPNMTIRLKRSVLAHEIAHAIHGDVRTMFGPVNAKQERRADEWAALHLIRLDDYRRAEEIHNGHAPAIALELDVITRTVDAYRSMLERIGDMVYLRPGLGAGQWRAKIHLPEAA